MDAVILAAGQGTRLRGVGASKPMVTVEGTALLERVVQNAIMGGVTRFVVVTGYNAAPLINFTDDLASRLKVEMTCVENKLWHLGNGRSAIAAQEMVDNQFHLLMADHLVDPTILEKVRSTSLPDNGACLGVDFALNNPHVDLDDVTKVQCNRKRVLAIGKSLPFYNGFDTGVFWCSHGLFNAINESIEASGDDSLSGGVRVLSQRGRMACADVSDCIWIDVDTPAVLDLAQQAVRQPKPLLEMRG